MNDPYLKAERRRAMFVEALHSQIGRPYLWGGQSEAGFDCSGLILWALGEAGVRLDDMTAQGLADHYHANRLIEPGKPGELLFYGNGTREAINHVMAVLTTWGAGLPILVGSRGGIDSTTNLAEAYRRRAYVGVRTADYWRSKLVMIVDPFMVRT